ncbi:hypothetical protein ACJRO7_020959 [Eucalyptus globulus]|uniref:F-box domain-containing protein n=1 Tax=Eucalyptus globulus TaxID=34317 RepID=A0ABD3KPG3_EUCGL
MAGISKQIIGQKDDEDYISLLPDYLIHHIFSFLHMRDVVKTCVLSKRWQSVWTTVSDLRFSVSSYDDSFVDRVLTLYGLDKVRKFHLEVNLKPLCPSKIDSWAGFAIDHQVEELLLDLNIWWADCPLSPLLYNCSSLTKLCLSGCCFSLSESINWSSLKSLSIHSMDVIDDVLQKILMGSPVLEYLNLKRCWGVQGIRSTSLKELVIEDISVGFPLHILTPRLLSLRVRGYYFDEIIRIVEAPSLLEAELDFDGPITSDFCGLKRMLCQPQNATRVLFGPSCVEVSMVILLHNGHHLFHVAFHLGLGTLICQS